MYARIDGGPGGPRPGGARVVLATDLDGTMAHGPAADRELLLELLREGREATLIYVTGRAPDSARALARRTALPEPDVLIADVGTSVLRGMGPERLEEIEAELDRGWPGADVVRERLSGMPDLSPQDVHAPRRVSWWIEPVRQRESAGEGDGAGRDPFAARDPAGPTLDADAAAIADHVARQVRERLGGMDVDVLVSANVFLDVLPRGVHKGSTLRRVLRWLDVADHDCVVAGDSLNDLALFETGLAGIAVANCEPALRRRVAALATVYQAAGEGVTGILEGMRHHGLLPPNNGSGTNAQ